MKKMTFDQINPESERGRAYDSVKRLGGFVDFQTEEGRALVRYVKPKPPHEIMPGLMSERSPGYWFEKPVPDTTKIIPDANLIGFKVIDPDDGQGA